MRNSEKKDDATNLQFTNMYIPRRATDRNLIPLWLSQTCTQWDAIDSSCLSSLRSAVVLSKGDAIGVLLLLYSSMAAISAVSSLFTCLGNPVQGCSSRLSSS